MSSARKSIQLQMQRTETEEEKKKAKRRHFNAIATTLDVDSFHDDDH
jgi:hypothetical protein